MGEAQKTYPICFVGLGPGDPALLTARARERLASADVVLGEGEATVEALLEGASEGKRVVRTVAGDALESMAVAREAHAVSKAGVAFEIVPGPGSRSHGGAFGWAVVALGEPSEASRWLDRRPLFGKRVLVTRAREQSAGTAELLRDRGAEPIVVPTIEIVPASDAAPLEAALATLRAGGYAWVVFTSANGVERTWGAVVSGGGDARAFGGSRIAAIGPATARALEGHGLRADVVAKEFRGEGLAEALLAAAPAGTSTRPRALLARAAKARDVLPDTLRAAGWDVDVVAAYETRAPSPAAADDLVRDLERGRIDAVVLTSSSTVDHLCDLLGPAAPSLLARVCVASIGPVTTATAIGRGVRVDVTAAAYTVPGLVHALEESWA